MSEHPTLRAAHDLCVVLEAENSALQAMDIGRANALLGDKQAAANRLMNTRALIETAPALEWAEAGRRLGILAADNKRLLERAMVAQNRLMACIAHAVARVLPAASGYGAGGFTARPASLPPVALSNSA
jgi:hypothetical protein